MITIDDFGETLDLAEEILGDAYAIFREQLVPPRPTFAASAADLAEGLRRLGADEVTVAAAVHLLATERRR